jgi:hypothetical protein
VRKAFLQRLFHSGYGRGQCASSPEKIHPRNGRPFFSAPQILVLTYPLPEILLFHYRGIYSRPCEQGRIDIVNPFAGGASAVGNELHSHDLTVKKLQNGRIGKQAVKNFLIKNLR